MSIAACDPDAFHPLRALVSGPFVTLDELTAIERFIRTVVLHDEIFMELTPWPYQPEVDFEFTEEEKQRGGRMVITAIGPVLTGYDFFTDLRGPQPVPEIELSAALVEIASQHANAGEGNVYFKSHIEYLKRMLGVVERGGSALLCGEFGQQALTAALRYPELLFQQLDEEWQRYARRITEDGLGLRIPPVLGIVLTRCGRRDAIPAVIRDLRDEWYGTRKKVWDLLDALRVCRKLEEALEIQNELAEASRLFSPERTELDTDPIRVLWEILASGVAGASVAALSGGKPAIGAVAGTLTQAARNLPAFTHKFGAMLFGRGAFDLARRVRREVSKIELDALPRLLTKAERKRLGFR